jgi:hypothetical protein
MKTFQDRILSVIRHCHDTSDSYENVSGQTISYSLLISFSDFIAKLLLHGVCVVYGHSGGAAVFLLVLIWKV